MLNIKRKRASPIKTKELTFYGVFIGIIILLTFVPWLGYITLPGGISITTIHIPVIIGSYFYGMKGGSILGGAFGITSVVKSLMTPTDGLSIAIYGSGLGFYSIFLFIVILILPRILIGITAGGSYKVCKKVMPDILAKGSAAFIGSITNTVFVLGALTVFALPRALETFGVTSGGLPALMKVFLTVIALNSLVEAAAAVVLCTAVGKALEPAFGRNR